MSTSPTIHQNESQSGERRSGSREPLKWVVLVYFGQDNWGKLIDLSETGMRFEFAQTPSESERVNFTFQAMGRLPDSFGGEIISDSFEATGDVRWTRDFERIAGVQFATLQEESHEQIRKWLSFEASGVTAHASNKAVQQEQERERIPLPEPSEPAPVLPETLPTIHKEELQLDAVGTGSATEPLANPASPLMQKILEAPTFPAYCEVIAEEEKRGQAKNSESNWRISRTQVIGVAVGLAIVLVIGGVKGNLPRLAYGVRGVERVGSSAAGEGEPINAQSSQSTVSPRPFLVEVLDAQNRRWLLWFDSNSSKNAATQATYRSSLPFSAASSKGNNRYKQPAASTKPSAPHPFTLIAPKASRPQVNSPATSLLSPGAPVVRDELQPPLEAPMAGILSSHAIPSPISESVPMGGKVQLARLLKSVPPIYPQLARTNHAAGDVVLDALIDANGNVTELKVVSGLPLLRQAAMDAVRQWKYDPARLNGRPVPVHLEARVRFHAE